MELLDPFGRAVFGPGGIGSQTSLVLGATGTYLLLVEGQLGASGTQSIEFVSSLDSQSTPAALTGTAITVGTAVTNNFTANGEQDYVFNASAGARIYFDNLIKDQGGIVYSLTGPGGVVIPFTPFYAADGTENVRSAGHQSAAFGHIPGPGGRAVDSPAATASTFSTSRNRSRCCRLTARP